MTTTRQGPHPAPDTLDDARHDVLDGSRHDVLDGSPDGVRALSFTGDRVVATVVRDTPEFRVEGRAIVVNCGAHDVWVAEPPRRPIPPLSSTILADTTVEGAGLLVVLRTDDRPRDDSGGPEDGDRGDSGSGSAGAGAITGEPGWRLLGDLIGEGTGDTGGLPFDRSIPLWRSPVDSIGRVAFDPARLLRQTPSAGPPQPFEVRVNLWFAPAGTDCFIHDRHDFIEVHTQVTGLGRMQKFRSQDHATLYQDVLMSPGYTTPDPFCAVGSDGTCVYPWHQYHADTDCTWLAIEYHRVPR
ncbi:hypothetical protein [Streptomyces sp. NPDC047000]|uniref:hypothetical protein n=1 Tax=Streptomyces sp. NPDC047000 TaxID=3155474 RepID=UPI00340377AE